jgi:poly-gamma-glutamate synthesis protein (capsule biosynthesis protein)
MAAACNHSLDFGPDGVRSTADVLRSRRVAFGGLNDREEDASRMTLLEAGGIRLGVLSFTFGLNAHLPPADRPWLVNRMNLNGRVPEVDFTQVEAQMEHGRKAGVDFVIAQLHWGMEYELYPRPAQLEVARHLAEMGVDAIVGHHPHVLQPFECYTTRRDPDRVVPIFYSLGNLTNPFSAPDLCRSGVARIDLAKGTVAGSGSDGGTRTYVRNATLSEVVQVVDPVHRRIRLEDASPGSPRIGA